MFNKDMVCPRKTRGRAKVLQMEECRDLPTGQETIGRTRTSITPRGTKPDVDITNDHTWGRPSSKSSSEAGTRKARRSINTKDCMTEEGDRDRELRHTYLRDQRPKGGRTKTKKTMMLSSRINFRRISACECERKMQVLLLINVPGLSSKHKIILLNIPQEDLPLIPGEAIHIDVSYPDVLHWAATRARAGAEEGPGCLSGAEMGAGASRATAGTRAAEGPGCPSRAGAGAEAPGVTATGVGEGRGRSRLRSQAS